MTSTPSPLSYGHDGRKCLGFILARGKLGLEAFNAKSVSIFETQRQAANPLLIKEGGPANDAIPDCLRRTPKAGVS